MKEWILEQVRLQGFCRLDKALFDKTFPGREKTQTKQVARFCHEHGLKWRSYPRQNHFEFRKRSDTELISVSN